MSMEGKEGMKIRKAQLDDLKDILDLLEQAKQSLANNGVDQWQNGYPNAEVISVDIKKGQSYVMEDDQSIIGTAAIVLEDDPNYNRIWSGEWRTDGPYGVIHRIAISPKRKGQRLAGQFFSYAVDLCHAVGFSSLRIDTHKDNISMQRAIQHFGFIYCGVVQMSDGSFRNAYEYIEEDQKDGF